MTHQEHTDANGCSPDVLVKEIELSCGKKAIVDAEDWPKLSRMAWCDKGGGYVHARWKKSIGGNGKIVDLHRFIMRAPSGYVVDHIDGNPLNNSKSNLQITTTSRNMMRAHANGGVTRLHNSSRWRARLRIDGVLYSLGCYDTEEEARKAVCAAKKEAWGNPEINQLGTIGVDELELESPFHATVG